MTQGSHFHQSSSAARRTPAEIAQDPTLSNARKIELLKSIKEFNAGAKDQAIVRDADLVLAQMLGCDPYSGRH